MCRAAPSPASVWAPVSTPTTNRAPERVPAVTSFTVSPATSTYDGFAQQPDPPSLARFAGVSLSTRLVSADRVAALHDAGLQVWTWTLRPENAFLPLDRRTAAGDAEFGDWRGHWRSLLDAGVDAVFTDHPDLAVALRQAPA